jgi:hypothetical protein
MRSTFSALFPAICLLFFGGLACAQSDRGTITGTVTDTSGAVIANASVVARQIESGEVFNTATTLTGNYTLAQLPVGPYEIEVSVQGFKRYVRSGIVVQVAQIFRIDVSLEVGAASEAVTVVAEASLLKTESGDVSHNVDVGTLNDLPMLGTGSAAAGSSGIRNPNNVLTVIPGVYYVPNSQVKINGAQTNSYAYHVEGIDSTNFGFPYAAAQTQPSVDAIQEVAVQTSNFSAEYGAVGGGFINVTMRSGGNQYHGSGYDYLVNEALNAGTPFTDAGLTDSHRAGQLVRPRARRHDYGWTVGGPISIPKLYSGKDRSFFFFNFEQFRETQIVNNAPITVPTAAYRTGDFSGARTAAGNARLSYKDASGNTINTDAAGNPLIANTIYDPTTIHQVNGQNVYDPFSGNAIPFSRLDPVALAIQKLIPAPTNPAASLNNYLPVYPSIRHTTIPSVKIDQVLTSKQKLSFYWSFTHTDSQFSSIYGNYEGLPTPITAARGTFIHSHVERLNYDYVLRPTLLVHLTVGYQQNNFFDDAPVLDYNAQTALGLKGATVNRQFPRITGNCAALNICTAAGGMYEMGPAGQTHSYWEKPGTNANIVWVRDNHTWKAGADLYWSAVPQAPYTFTAGQYSISANQTAQPYLVGTTLSGGSIGFPYASFLLGLVDNYSIAAPADFRQAKKQLGYFVQDSWKVNRRLTINYGARYDFGTYYREEHGRAVDFSATTPNPSAAGSPGAFLFEGSGPGHCNCDFARNYPYAIGPRIGAAYSLNDKTVVRVGWGFIYGATSVNPGGVNTAGIVNTYAVGSPGQGKEATTLSAGIPLSATWPVISAGVAPQYAIGAQALPTGVGLLDPQAGRPPRQNQWSIGIQRELTRNIAIEAAYVGNRGVWWQSPALQDINALTPQVLLARGIDINSSIDQALLLSPISSAAAAARGFNKAPYQGFSTSQTVAQSLRPFPQFGNIPVTGNPQGKTWYDSLQTKFTQRATRGLTTSLTFSWQKSQIVGLTGGGGSEGNGNTTVSSGGANTTYVNNVVAGALNNKSISGLDQTLLLTVAVSYTTPGVTQNRWISSTLRGWQISSVLGYSSGLPIPVPAATTSIASQLFQPSLMNRVPGVPLYLVDSLNCHCFDPAKTPVLNPAAFVNPAQGQFAVSSPYYSDFRYARHPQENINFGRTWRVRERYTMQVRVDFSNMFNRTFLANPTATNPTVAPTRNGAGLLTGGYGYINLAYQPTNQLAQPRNGTLVLRLTF